MNNPQDKIISLPRNIYQRINMVMREVDSVQKEKKKVNGQYTFVSHDAVSAALHKPMVDAGIVMIPSICELTQDGNRTIAKMDISFVNIDQPDDKVVVNYMGYGIDQSDKGIGKAVSYAVKYALLKVFCLETGDDVEKDDISYKGPKGLSEEQIRTIYDYVGGDAEIIGKILKSYQVNSLSSISEEHYQNIIKRLQLRKAQSNENTQS